MAWTLLFSWSFGRSTPDEISLSLPLSLYLCLSTPPVTVLLRASLTLALCADTCTPLSLPLSLSGWCGDSCAHVVTNKTPNWEDCFVYVGRKKCKIDIFNDEWKYFFVLCLISGASSLRQMPRSVFIKGGNMDKQAKKSSWGYFLSFG